MNKNPKIFKAADVEAYFDSTKIKKDAQLYCRKLIQKAKIEAGNIRQQAYKEAINQLHQESRALNLQLQQKNQKFVEQLEIEIYSIIDQILIKLGIRDNFSKHISTIVKEELQKSNINKNEYLSLSANTTVLKQLQNELINNINIDNIIFKLDDSLTDNECLYETNLYLMRININQLRSQIDECAFITKSEAIKNTSISNEFEDNLI